ncbi:MAG: beta-phosphoglucomutase family hydrolase [Elusimicrobiota bacterium]|jgi:beta-phosphoglucomutase
MGEKRAFLFDLDGVIADNMRFHASAWRRFFLERGIRLDMPEFYAKTSGMPTRDVLAYYFRRPVPKAEADRLTGEKEALYRRLYRPRMKPLPGLRLFLRRARKQGFALGVGTGSKADNAGFILDGLRLRPAFDAVVCACEVRRGKPHPETFLKLARRLKVRPKDCIVFEDSLLGEESGLRAGMRVVAVSTSHPRRDFRSPIRVIKDFRVGSALDLFDAF